MNIQSISKENANANVTLSASELVLICNMFHLIQLSDNICTVAEHAKESIPFQLTADEFCLVTGVDIYKSNLQEDKK